MNPVRLARSASSVKHRPAMDRPVILRRVVGAAALLALSTGCAMVSDATARPEGLWIVEDVNSGGIIDSSRIEITFSNDGGVSGSIGCNRFTGQYELDASTLSFGPLAATERACAPALNQQEARVLAALNAVESWSLDETGALILEGPAPHRLLARRGEAD